MSEEEKKAIENLKLFLDKDKTEDNYLTGEDLSTILNLVQKQEKVIDEMAQELINAPLRVFGDNAFKFRNKEDTKQYFYEKVDDNKNEN